MSETIFLTQAQYELLVSFRAGPQRFPGDASGVLKELYDRSYVSVHSSSMPTQPPFISRPESWCITVKGEDALNQFEYRRAEEAKQKRQQRFENQISVASVLVPAITFLLGLAAEHFGNILGRLIALVK